VIPLVALLVACGSSTDGELTVHADTSTVTLSLRNPTVDADPMAGVDGWRVEVVADGDVVASDTFGLDEEATIEHVAEYGVIRFQVAGTRGGDVRSYGRSMEVVPTPGVDLLVPVTFLPVNEVFALASPMAAPRSAHAAVLLRDGRVLLAGGRDPAGAGTLSDVELYDVVDGAFAASAATLGTGTADPRAAWTTEEEVLLVGGAEIEAGKTSSLATVYRYGPVDDTLESLSPLVEARRDHCLAQYLPNAILVLGGPGTGATAEELRYQSDKGAWLSTRIDLQGGFTSEAVTGCAADEGGRVLVLGVDGTATGTWDGLSDVPPAEAFVPIRDPGDTPWLRGAVLLFREPGVAWVAGGEDAESGVVRREGWDFRMDDAAFAAGTGLSAPRRGASWSPWMEGGWYAVCCGTSDAEGRNAVPSLELVNPATGADGPVMDLDRERLDGRITALPDGSLLVTGGFDARTPAAAATAAIAVPYLGE